jgi:inner membrane protein
MHRQGHSGIVLLALAAIDSILLSAGRPLLALLAWSMFWIEPLPDRDQRIGWLEHRGTSHSLFAAGVIGGCCAGLGWLVGTYVTRPVLPWLRANVLVGPQWSTWTTTHFAVLDAASLALLGFCVGTGGIVLHLLGDVITVSGIQPLLPFSRWNVSLSPLRAANPVVNRGLLVLGVLAIVTVGVTATPLEDYVLAMLGLGEE